MEDLNDNKIDLALDIMQQKIIKFMKEFKVSNKENSEEEKELFKKEFIKLVQEKEKIYDLDEETIKKVYNEYLKEVKEGN